LLIPAAKAVTPGSGGAGGSARPKPDSKRRLKSIRVVNLPAVGAESGGVLTAANGGLGADMWRGSRRETVERLLSRLPAGSRSPALRALMRRLLLSAAVPPRGDEKSGGRSLLGLRAERLLAMGDLAGVEKLSAGIPEKAVDNALARARVDALLLDGKETAACKAASELILRDLSRYLQKLMAYCQLRAGEGDAADLGLMLLQEPVADQSARAAAADALFFDFFERIRGKKPGRPLETVADGTPLILTMVATAGLSVPTALVDAAGPPVLAALAGNAKVDRHLRLRAAERGLALGLVAPDVVRRLYMGFTFKSLTPKRVLAAADKRYDATARARIYRAAMQATDPGAQARLLAAGLRRARAAGAYRMVARTLAPLIADIKPKPARLWFADVAVPALYATGNLVEARAWQALLRANGPPGSTADKIVSALWPLARLADGFSPPPADPARLKVWWEAQRAAHPAAAKTRAALLFAALDGLEDPLGTIRLTPLLAAAEQRAAGAGGDAPWRLLAAMSKDGRKGETVLTVLVSLGAGDLARVNPVVLRAALRALRRVGLVEEARAVAFDAAIAAGI